MTQSETPGPTAVAGAGFREGYVEADGFRIRYLEAGEAVRGEPLVCLHGAGGPRIYRSHALLAARHRVIVFETPGFGFSPANERSQSLAALANTIAAALTALGVARFNLMGNSFGGKLALWLAVQQAERLPALVLIAPAAIRAPGSVPAAERPPAELNALLYAHPERLEPAALAPLDPAIRARQLALVGRMMGPPRDPDLESRLPGLTVPVLTLFGTRDRLIPPEMGRVYCELLPNCHFALVYDAAHEADADRPEACAALIDDFVRRREEFLVNQQSGLLYR